MELINIIQEYGIFVYALVIFFGGLWGLKYFAPFQKTTWNFLLFSTLAAIIFLAIEMYTGSFKKEDLLKYFITYTVVTSVYENVKDFIPFTKGKKTDDGN